MNYPVIIYPAQEGGFVAEVISFPGCIAQGETYQDCLSELDTVAELWKEEYLSNHQDLPNVNHSIEKLLEFNRLVFA